MHTRHFSFALVAVILALALSGCGKAPAVSGTPSTTPSTTPSPTALALTPYASPTATPTPSPAPVVKRSSPTPTPTPFFYTVKKGDTLLGIALKLGVSVKALKEANPGLNPDAMPIGTKLVVPLNEENPAALPTPTPIPLTLSKPICAPSPDGSVVCLCEVTNPTNQAVGAIEVEFSLGKETIRATSLLDLIPPHKRTVVVARATPPAPLPRHPTATLLRALAVPKPVQEANYPPVKITVDETKFTENRLGAVITGSITLPKKPLISEIWVLAIAYDENGNAIGARRVEITPPVGKTQPLKFSLGIYSIGVPITRTKVIAEAHAAPSGK